MSIPPIIPTSSGTSSANAYALPQKESLSSQTTINNDNTQRHTQSSAYEVNIQGGKQASYTYAHINHHQSQLSVEKNTDVSAIKEPSALLDGAKNILGFIETRIANEKAAGASDEALEALFQQGLSGFKQGYGEAAELLEGLSALSDTVNDSISTLYNQVVSGMEEMREKYLDNYEPAAVEAIEIAPSTPTLASSPVTESLLSNQQQESRLETSFKSFSNQNNSTITELLDSLSNNAKVDYTKTDQFSFELSTTDGDKISIQANSLSAFSGDYSTQQDSHNGSETALNTSSFSLQVDGDIDEKESIAIQALIDQVIQLADEFYNGDVETAYQAALELGFDSNEISGYALHLQQTETYSAVETYQQISPDSNTIAPEAFDIFERIGSYAQSVLETLNNTANYKGFDYTQLLEQISEQIDAQVNNEEATSFGLTVRDILAKVS